MIIVIGKEDKALIGDAIAYVIQSGDLFKDKRIKEDTKKVANRLLKAIHDKYRY